MPTAPTPATPATPATGPTRATGRKKIAMIGAGSVVFCKTLIQDILATPALRDSEFALMSPTETKLRRMETVGGHDAFGIDYHAPLKYGVDQCIGDTLGPGGIFRGLRHIPVLADIARDMEEVAKKHPIMLQY